MSRSTAKTEVALPRILERYPEHTKIAENVLKRFRTDKRVLGVYLAGSFAHGKPDRYSDLDFYLLVRSSERERLKRGHATIRAEVGELISEFPATHLGDPNQLIALYRATYPVHVDYQYRTREELVPRIKDQHVLILWDQTGELAAWKRKCSAARDTLAPAEESLQYFEDRFWTWCIYADSKLRRGELWEARDMIEYLRNKVIVPLMTYDKSLPFEGNRRIETKLSPDDISVLQSTLQKGHSRQGYAEALLALADLYVKLIDRVTRKFGLQIRRTDSDSIRKVLARRTL